MSFTGPPSFSDIRGPYINQQIPEDLDRIPLKDIIEATNNFAEENIIEKNEYWTVYTGELSGKKLAFVSVYYFLSISINPVVLLEHQNIVSFVGCCHEDKITIIVVDHPTRGGLNKHVSGAHVTWLMRVKISLDIASGLHYLVDHSDIRVEDLNIAGICLDENWQAKIQLTTPTFLIKVPSRNGDYSEVGEANHLRKSSMDDDDHLYIQVGESKMYYFGVILFQLLCGRLAVTYDEEGGAQLLSKLARSHYEKGTLTEIIDPLLRVQMNRDSIAIFSEVAYIRCTGNSSDNNLGGYRTTSKSPQTSTRF
ncbi:kinase-like domain-containing protein [Tanacetum coccineum]